MDAITVTRDGQLRLGKRDEPRINSDDDVKLQVLRVGICGTDREQVQGNPIEPPHGFDDLVIGHEMIARVVDAGDKSRFDKGDFAIVTVRRGCNRCLPCAMNRPDMCRTGDFSERGIARLDGFQTQYVSDKQQFIVPVPKSLGTNAVLAEPTSIVEKAISELEAVQQTRLPDAGATPLWLNGKRCLVAGLGPVGLLAAMVLRLRGATVYGLDVVDAGSARPKWLEKLGGTYIDGRAVSADQIDDHVGKMDVIVEAAGVAGLAFNLIDALGWNGAYVLTGLPSGHKQTSLPAADLMSQMVRSNQCVLGSVNAAHDHVQMAVQDLADAQTRWPGCLDQIITHHYKHEDFKQALEKQSADEIKVVVEWSA